MWMWIILAIVILLVLILIIVSNYLVSFSLDTKSYFFISTQFKRQGKFKVAEDFEANHKWLEENSSLVELVSHDGLILKAHYVSCKTSGKKTVLLVHGYGGNPEEMVRFARHYIELGYDCYLPEQRAHGLSEGRYISMGYNESKDMLLWVNFICQKAADTQLLLHGVSMGAATVMMLCGMELPSNVKVCIEDCGYNTVSGIFTDKLKRIFHLPAFPFIPLGSLCCKIRAGYTYNSGNSVESLKKSSLPMVFIHGSKDDFIPISMMDEVYEACPNDKIKLVVEGAEHAQSILVNPELYWKTVEPFIQKYIK